VQTEGLPKTLRVSLFETEAGGERAEDQPGGRKPKFSMARL
jgi:hypothetical protein